MNNELISVIVPIYKVEPYLDRCIDSIVNQTHKNLEIILVDDGSPDNCGVMCDEWAKKDSRIKVIHKENGGLSDARNAGMAVATGEYISFIDSDDWVATNFIQALYGAMIDNNCDMAECNYLITRDTTIDSNNNFHSAIEICDNNTAMIHHLEDRKFKQVVWNKLYRRDIITIEFEKGRYHEDLFWTYQIISKSKRLVHIDDTLYYYFQRNDSIMGETYSLKRLDALDAKCARLNFIKEHFPTLYNDAVFNLWTSCRYQLQMALIYLSPDEFDKASSYVMNVYKTHVETDLEFSFLPPKEKIWYALSKFSFYYTCKIRNFFQIGL